MAILVSTHKQAGHYLVSEDSSLYLSREQAMLSGAGPVLSGTVLGKITATGVYAQLAPGASDGTQNAAAILWEGRDPTAGAVRCVVTARDAQIMAEELVWPGGISGPQKTAAIGKLADLHIILR